MSDQFFELYPTILIRASSMGDADRQLCELLDMSSVNVRCFGWATMEAEKDAHEVFDDDSVEPEGQ